MKETDHMSGFRFKLNGHRVSDELFDQLRRARGTHGDLAFVEAKAANVFSVTRSDGTKKTLSGDVRLSNMLNEDILAEPARRAAYKAAHGADTSKSDSGS
jgi:hypothetical protein